MLFLGKWVKRIEKKKGGKEVETKDNPESWLQHEDKPKIRHQCGLFCTSGSVANKPGRLLVIYCPGSPAGRGHFLGRCSWHPSLEMLWRRTSGHPGPLAQGSVSSSRRETHPGPRPTPAVGRLRTLAEGPLCKENEIGPEAVITSRAAGVRQAQKMVARDSQACASGESGSGWKPRLKTTPGGSLKVISRTASGAVGSLPPARPPRPAEAPRGPLQT